jgi:competence protein ComFC
MNLLDVIFPKKCLGCGKEGSYICSDCIGKIELAIPICPYCFRPSINGQPHILCQRDLGLDKLIEVWRYRGVVRKAIIALKYKFISSLASEIADNFSKQIKKNKTKFPKKAILVPIPLYWKRRYWRGYNQTEEMGKYIAKTLKIRFVPDLIIKKTVTKQQVELRREKRLENLKGAFEINPEYRIKHKKRTVILFDDVWTTGSTIKEVARILKAKGIENVWGLTLAR